MGRKVQIQWRRPNQDARVIRPICWGGWAPLRQGLSFCCPPLAGGRQSQKIWSAVWIRLDLLQVEAACPPSAQESQEPSCLCKRIFSRDGMCPNRFRGWGPQLTWHSQPFQPLLHSRLGIGLGVETLGQCHHHLTFLNGVGPCLEDATGGPGGDGGPVSVV